MQFNRLRRREFMTLLGGAAEWPLAARAQQAMPVVGYVRSTTAAGFANLEVAVRQGLEEAGFVDGQNVVVEFHYADNRADRLSALIADLIRRPVDVIVGNVPTARVAKAATTTVPIVFVSGSDPVGGGLVASLSRPGGNVTGASFMATAVAAKRLALLHQLAPKATTIAALLDPNSPTTKAERSDLPPAAQTMGLRLPIFDVGSGREIEAAVASAVQGGAGALFVGGGGFLNSQRDRLVALAARHKLPASFIVRETVLAGGLMSYGPSQTDAYRQAGGYVARILKGAKPAELPVMQATKFEFVLNLKTAKTLGLAVTPAMLALADDVIDR
jgi:putative ABC transport system substrate-binding protein